MNWGALGTFLGGLVVAIGERLFGPKPPPPAPAPPPDEPSFTDIDAKIDDLLERIEAERAPDSAKPVLIRPPPLPPRTPLASAPEDRAENGGAMRGDEEPPPTVKPLRPMSDPYDSGGGPGDGDR